MVAQLRQAMPVQVLGVAGTQGPRREHVIVAALGAANDDAERLLLVPVYLTEGVAQIVIGEAGEHGTLALVPSVPTNGFPAPGLDSPVAMFELGRVQVADEDSRDSSRLRQAVVDAFQVPDLCPAVRRSRRHMRDVKLDASHPRVRDNA